MGEFPDSSRSVVELALETCSYDESKARQLLATFNSTARPTSATKAATTTGSAASVDSRVSITVTSATAASSVSAADTSAVSGAITSVASPSDVTVGLSSRPGTATAAVHGGIHNAVLR